MTDPNILAIPEATMRRGGKWQDAARLYIHERQTVLADLARRVGLHPVRLSIVKREDDWDGFTASLAGRSMTSVFSRSVVFERDEVQVKLMKQEVEDQIALVEKLRIERARIETELTAYTPGTKSYTGALSALALVRKEIEAMIGLDDMKAEVSAMRVDRLKKTKDTGPSAGRIVELG